MSSPSSDPSIMREPIILPHTAHLLAAVLQHLGVTEITLLWGEVEAAPMLGVERDLTHNAVTLRTL